MALNLDEKKNIAIKINQIVKKSLSVVLASSRNISVNKINALRKISRQENVFLYVIKNTLLKISLKNTQLECLNRKISGPTIIGCSLDHPGSAAKIFRKFSQKNKNFKITTAAMHNKILSKTEIIDLANLPNLKEAIAKFIFTIKNATIGKLFSILLQITKENNIKINTTVVN
ncbi:50S ribosomal protein L10 [Buchnera aphidicola]|uniref:Large ribosomal subunit protein uL10 n=1 Tax=Buchnera aphidicola (Sarucallis kahawaluokalani) TaxID=1241878 RepID=A0A4D6YJ09_9GAMM|nr:50S ribosomal protein L10 [Buchnera aphidicola]QCI25840.1 50S ribosomal protein L10 [Buchnera aphidicola (Sarucallis kahawaluokalani)]